MSRFSIVVLLLAVTYVTCDPTPQQCPEHEHWYICGQLCEPTCNLPKPNPRLCPAIECTSFTANCRCDEGYVRNNEGHCVNVKKC